jgi:hypothetical protein
MIVICSYATNELFINEKGYGEPKKFWSLEIPKAESWTWVKI